MLQFNPKNKELPYFVIPFQIPGLNEYLSQCNRSPHTGNKMKQDNTMLICNCIRRYLKRKHFDKKIILHYHIYVTDKKHDKDNIFAMVSKCTQDALVRTKVIDNDGWKNIENFTHDFFVSNKPCIIVYLEEIDD